MYLYICLYIDIWVPEFLPNLFLWYFILRIMRFLFHGILVVIYCVCFKVISVFLLIFSLWWSIIFILPLVFLDMISFSYLNTFNVADLKSLSSKFSIWVSSETVSIFSFFCLCVKSCFFWMSCNFVVVMENYTL